MWKRVQHLPEDYVIRMYENTEVADSWVYMDSNIQPIFFQDEIINRKWLWLLIQTSFHEYHAWDLGAFSGFWHLSHCDITDTLFQDVKKVCISWAVTTAWKSAHNTIILSFLSTCNIVYISIYKEVAYNTISWYREFLPTVVLITAAHE